MFLFAPPGWLCFFLPADTRHRMLGLSGICAPFQLPQLHVDSL